MQHSDYNLIHQQKSTTFFTRIKRFFAFFRHLGTFSLVIIIISVMVLAFWSIQKATSSSSVAGTPQQNGQDVTITKPITQKTVNKTFTFPLRDQQGQEVGKLSYTVESVEIRDQIIVQGQPANSVKGKKFFIINLKLTNNHNQTVQVNAKDYLRVSIGNSSDKLAPDMHNDPVEVQAISTKPTRLGLAINETDKNIVLQVGEISGEKETIQVNL